MEADTQFVASPARRVDDVNICASSLSDSLAVPQSATRATAGARIDQAVLVALSSVSDGAAPLQCAEEGGRMLYFKAPGRCLRQDSLAAEWGECVRYLEVADDQYVVRQVEVFDNGNE